MLLTQVQIFAVLICFCLEFCPVCFLIVPAWTLLYVCGLRVLLDVEDYRFVVTSSKLLFHMVSCDLRHIVCCNGKIWAACCSPCSRVVCVWTIRMVFEHHLVCYDPVFHFFSQLGEWLLKSPTIIHLSPSGLILWRLMSLVAESRGCRSTKDFLQAAVWFQGLLYLHPLICRFPLLGDFIFLPE